MGPPSLFSAEEASERLLHAFVQMRSSTDWTSFLRFASKFHSYSSRNLMLIWSQSKERGFVPSRVAGYGSWKSLGRQVKRGERGLQIFAPVFVDRATPRVKDGEANRAFNEAPVAFRRSYVFDISQTEGEDLAEPLEPQLLIGSSSEQLMAFLHGEVARHCYTLSFQRLQGCNGWTNVATREIVVSSELPSLQQSKTLVHELAHAVLHKEDPIERNLAELEAESAAWMFFGFLGIDSSNYSISYLLRWSGGEASQLLHATIRALEFSSSLLKGWEELVLSSGNESSAMAP